MWPPSDDYPFRLRPSQIAYMQLYRQHRTRLNKHLEVPIDAQMNIGPYCPTSIPITIYTILPARTLESDKTAGQVAYCARPELSSPNQFKEVFSCEALTQKLFKARVGHLLTEQALHSIKEVAEKAFLPEASREHATSSFSGYKGSGWKGYGYGYSRQRSRTPR